MEKNKIALKKDFYNCEFEYVVITRKRLIDILTLGKRIKSFKVLNSYGETRMEFMLSNNKNDLQKFFEKLNYYLSNAYVVELCY